MGANRDELIFSWQANTPPWWNGEISNELLGFYCNTHISHVMACVSQRIVLAFARLADCTGRPKWLRGCFFKNTHAWREAECSRAVFLIALNRFDLSLRGPPRLLFRHLHVVPHLLQLSPALPHRCSHAGFRPVRIFWDWGNCRSFGRCREGATGPRDKRQVSGKADRLWMTKEEESSL